MTPSPPLSPRHRDMAVPGGSERLLPTTGLGGDQGGGIPNLHNGANTPKHSRGSQSSKRTTANPAIAPAVGFQLGSRSKLSQILAKQTHPGWAAPAGSDLVRTLTVHPVP